MARRIPKARNGLIAALDVGSSKVCCLIARVGRDERPRVIGIGQHESRGVKAGAIIDMEAAEASILAAVHSAEQMASETIQSLYVNLTGGHPASSAVGVEVSIAGHAVGDGDLKRVMDEGHTVDHGKGQNGNGRQLIHSIPIGYTIDGCSGIRDPRGMFGDRLGVNIHFVTAATGPVRNLMTCIQRCHLDVDGLVVSPYAAGLSSLVEDELSLGVTVIDMGGGTTSIAVFFEGTVIYTAVVPYGGLHVTNDIARGRATPVTDAERMKVLSGHAIAVDADKRDMIDVPSVGEERVTQPQQIPRARLVGIIRPRVEEIFEMVRDRLAESGIDALAGHRVVLTGGACQLTGIRELAALVLNRQVRLGRPMRVNGLAESTAGPAYATCVGLLNYAAASNVATPSGDRPYPGRPTGLVGRIGTWFREHF